MIGYVTQDDITYADPPHRFEAGTPPIVQAIGLGEAVEYMMSIGTEAIMAHEKQLLDYATQRLSALNSMRLFGTAPNKGSILSFEMRGVHAHDISTIIDRSGVAVRAGTHCAEPLMSRFGVTSTCRASFAMYNTLEEVDALADSLVEASKFFA
jgi:cysteine desulfurase/selenocysteine lyase